MTVSFERAGILMSVIKMAAELGPKDGNSISALAAMELRYMDDEARKEVAERNAKMQADAAAKAAAEAEERAAQAEADKESVAEKKELPYSPPQGPKGQSNSGPGLGGTTKGPSGTQGTH